MAALLLYSSTATPTVSLMVGRMGKLKEPNHNLVLSAKKPIRGCYLRSRSINCNNFRKGVRAFFFNPAEDPVLKEALKEPVAFAGGLFAGILRLDLNEEPLKEWVWRTVESAGINLEEMNPEGSTVPDAEAEQEEGPTEIEIQ